jgi:hypothetical protein
MRDLSGSPVKLAQATTTLEAHADRVNAQQARLIAVRRLLLLGRLRECAIALDALDPTSLTPPLLAVSELAKAELALRSLHTQTAKAALSRARTAAVAAGIVVLQAEVDAASTALTRPAARQVIAGREHALRLHEVEALLNSGVLVVDACRHGIRVGTQWRSLARRPVLFALARALAEAWPNAVDRQALITTVFRTRHSDESHRVRLRVEIGRLRSLIAPLTGIAAVADGYMFAPSGTPEVSLLLPPIEGDQASLSALLGDGEAWSSSALALALGVSQRQVQRALIALQAAGTVRSIGRARSQRWLAQPYSGFATNLLLPATLAVD